MMVEKNYLYVIFLCLAIVWLGSVSLFAQMPISFLNTPYIVNPEGSGGGSHNLTITLQVPAGGLANNGRVILVDYTCSDGTATHGSDYLGNAGTVSITVRRFLPSTATFTIAIVHDDDDEGNEDFSIALSNPRWQDGGTTPELTTPNSPQTVLIVDDDYQPYQLSIEESWVTEEDPMPLTKFGYLTVALDRPVAQNHTVRFDWATLLSGTATVVVDFIANMGMNVTFPTGEQYVTLQVRIVNDNHVEADESINVQLFDIEGRVTVINNQATLWIFDDDHSDFTVTKAVYTLDNVPVTDQLVLGQTYKYIGTVSNLGPDNYWSIDPASYVSVVDYLPQGLIFVSASGGGVYDAGTHTITWTFPMAMAWAPIASQTSEFTFMLDPGLEQGTPILNRVCVYLPEVYRHPQHEGALPPDPNTENDCSTYELPIFIQDVDFCGQFDSDRNVGLPPLCVNFWSLKPIIGYHWKFGDGHGDTGPKKSHHDYHYVTTPIDNTSYDIMLNGKENLQFITPYGPSELSYSCLKFHSGSPAHETENWENAIDGDTYWFSGTAHVTADATGKPWAIFQFLDEGVKKIGKIRMMTDTGIERGSSPDQQLETGGGEKQVRHFRVFVSTTGLAEADFSLLLDAEKRPIVLTPCDFDDDWAEWLVPATDAKYIKLVIDQPESFWRQLGEFEVYTQTTLADAGQSTLTADGNPNADGIDSAIVTLTLKDANGNPSTGKTFADIRFCALDKYTGVEDHINTWFGAVEEAYTPGVYTTHVKSKINGPKLLKAFVNGVLIEKTTIGGSEVCEVMFGKTDVTEGGGGSSGLPHHALVFVKGTPTAKGEGWDNAVDGDLDGWDGTTTARGADVPHGPAWAIFKFADGQPHLFDRVNIQLDNGTDDDAYAGRQATDMEILISSTNDQPTSFVSITRLTNLKPYWQYYILDQTYSAKYVKIILHEPKWATGSWRQIVEFGLDTAAKGGAVLASEALQIAAIPTTYAMEQNYPNPFNAETVIRYQLPEDTHVKVQIMDITGRVIVTLVNDRQEAGYKSVTWNARNVASGVYFCKLTAGKFSDMKRLVLIK